MSALVGQFYIGVNIPSGKKVGSIALLVLALAVFLPIVVGGSSEAVRRQLVSSYPELMAWLEPIYLLENDAQPSKCERLDDIVSGFEHKRAFTTGAGLSPVQRLVRGEGGDHFRFLRVFERERFVEQRSINPLGMVQEVEGRKADGGVWVKDKRYAYAVYDCGLMNPTRLL
jgi:hypothetical protein